MRCTPFDLPLAPSQGGPPGLSGTPVGWTNDENIVACGQTWRLRPRSNVEVQEMAWRPACEVEDVLTACAAGSAARGVVELVNRRNFRTLGVLDDVRPFARSLDPTIGRTGFALANRHVLDGSALRARRAGRAVRREAHRPWQPRRAARATPGRVHRLRVASGPSVLVVMSQQPLGASMPPLRGALRRLDARRTKLRICIELR